METSLHRELKRIYAGEGALTEQRVGRYRIDAVVGDELVEVQHGSLAAIRTKIAALVQTHRVRVVKPIIVSKRLINHARRGGRVVSTRMSPKRGQLLHLFDELIYFHQVFPHRRLTLEVPLVSIEELRYPGHGRRRRWGRRDHVVEDQRLVAIDAVHRLQSGRDLLGLIDWSGLVPKFDSGQLAESAGIPRYLAQRILYCLRNMKLAKQCGKSGRAWQYSLTKRRRSSAA